MDAVDPGRHRRLEATRTSLLEGLLDPANDRVWTEFFERYGPIIQGFARKLGLREHETDDAVQETMVTFVTRYREGDYDRQKGRLRSWLCGLAYHKIRHILERRFQREHRLPQEGGEADGDGSPLPVGAIPDQARTVALWEAEWGDVVIRHCLDLIRDETDPVRLHAFELYVLQGWSADDVAEELGISRNMVYLSKSRVLARVAELRDEVNRMWEGGFLP